MAGTFEKPAGTDFLFKSALDSEKLIPLCNSNAYTKDKTLLGKLKEVLGPVNKVYFSVEKDANFRGAIGNETVVYLNTKRILPLERFLPPEAKNP